MQRILVLRGGALGDFIVTLPALALLRQRWPRAHIALVGNAPAAELARARGLLDAAHSQHEARWSALFSAAPLPGELAAWLGGFDLVVNYWPDPDAELRRRFPMRSGQVFLSAEAMPTRAPAAAHYGEPLRALGLEAREMWFRLAPIVAASASEWTAPEPPLAHARHCISIHPGSGSPRKNWPAENWRALIAQLPAPVTLILGEAETEIWSRGAPAAVIEKNAARSTSSGSRARRGTRAPRLQRILLNPPLEELVTHLSSCRLFLGHDSGISHLAAGCGAPCVLLFGPTDPAMWAPPAPHVRVLQRGPDLSAISIDDVLRAVTSALGDQT